MISIRFNLLSLLISDLDFADMSDGNPSHVNVDLGGGVFPRYINCIPFVK